MSATKVGRKTLLCITLPVFLGSLSTKWFQRQQFQFKIRIVPQDAAGELFGAFSRPGLDRVAGRRPAFFISGIVFVGLVGGGGGRVVGSGCVVVFGRGVRIPGRVLFGGLFWFLLRWILVRIWLVGRRTGIGVLLTVEPFFQLLLHVSTIFRSFPIIRIEKENFFEVQDGVFPVPGDGTPGFQAARQLKPLVVVRVAQAEVSLFLDPPISGEKCPRVGLRGGTVFPEAIGCSGGPQLETRFALPTCLENLAFKEGERLLMITFCQGTPGSATGKKACLGRKSEGEPEA